MPASDLSPRDAQRAEAAKSLFRLLAGGAGVGMFGRGLLHLLQPSSAPEVPFVSPGPSPLPVPVPPEEEEGRPQLAKFAEELSKEALFDDQTLANGYRTLVENFPLDVTGITGLVGRNVTNPKDAPMMMPLSLGAAAAGTAGGWSLADWVLQKRRRAHIDSQLQQAKDEFQAALLSQAQTRRGEKTASEQSLSERLDVLFDQMAATQQSKEAGATADLASTPLGMYMTALGLLSGGSAYGMYHWTKNRSKAHLLDKALRERSRALWQRAPQTVVTIPTAPAAPDTAALAA